MENSQEVVVKPNQRLVRGILVSGLLVTLVYGGWGLTRTAAAQGTSGAFPILWVALFLWLGASIFLAALLCWIACGAEVMQIDGIALTIRRRLGSFYMGKPRVFVIDKIQRMRLEQQARKIKGKTVTRHVIMFDYLGHEQVLFAHLSRSQAEHMLNGPLGRIQ